MSRWTRPRFRGPERDAENDDHRFASVRLALTSALSSIDAEVEGLRVRLEAGRAWAAALVGTEDGSYFVREVADESALREAEREIKSGAERLSKLKKMRDVFVEAQTVLGQLKSS